MNVVYVTNNTLAGKVVAHGLVREVPISAIIIEEATLPRQMNAAKQFVFKVLGRPICEQVSKCKHTFKKSFLQLMRIFGFSVDLKLASIIEDTIIERAHHTLAEGKKHYEVQWPRGIKIYMFPSLNDPHCYKLLQTMHVDLIVEFGTKILKKNILQTARIGAINAHMAILPDYRGYFTEFWQVFNNDFEKSGITIHWITDSIDTGDIIFQKRTFAGTEKIDPFELNARNVLALRDSYGKICSMILNGTVPGIKQGETTTPVYRAKDITIEKKIELFRKIGLMK